MRIAIVNVTYRSGSTGTIVKDLAEFAKNSGHEVLVFCGRGEEEPGVIKVQTKSRLYIDALKSRFLDNQGFNSKNATKRLIEQLRVFRPDVINLHNIHGYYLYLPMLFSYLKNEYQGKIVITLHDSWLYTGHCSYYLSFHCQKWKTECDGCPGRKIYPKAYFAKAKQNFDRKMKLFQDLRNVTLVTPSEWLKKDVEQSPILSRFPCITINNGIDTSLCRKCAASKTKGEKPIILGVANWWNHSKGLDVFGQIQKSLGDSYRIVLCGGLKGKKPANLGDVEFKGLIKNQEELFRMFGKASVFVNPTRMDNYPTVNLESICCGTPVVCFDVGGCKETIKDPRYGTCVKDVEQMIREIKRYSESSFEVDYSQYDKSTMCRAYLELYESGRAQIVKETNLKEHNQNRGDIS